MYLWFVAAGLLLILELVTGTVLMLCLAIGSLGAAIVALFGGSILWQGLVMAVVSFASFFLLAPVMKRYYKKRSERRDLYVSGMDALIGRTGRVTEVIPADAHGCGRVQIDGDSWKAMTSGRDDLRPGMLAEVVSFDSVILTVRPTHRESDLRPDDK